MSNEDGFIMDDISKINYISCKLNCITGSDGGYTHSWKCNNEKCKKYGKVYNYSDK